MKRKKNNFSLLEVLIAMLLITAALPVLLTPFVYATADQKESIQKIKQEKMAFHLITMLLADLHNGAIPLNLNAGSDIPFKTEWQTDPWTGSYAFQQLRASKEGDPDNIELWQVTFTLKSNDTKVAPASFTFEFVIKKNKPLAPQEVEK